MSAAFEPGDVVRCVQEGARGADGKPRHHEGDVFVVESGDDYEVEFLGHNGSYKVRRFERVLTAEQFARLVELRADPVGDHDVD